MNNPATLKNRIQSDMKDAMRTRAKQKLEVIRFLLAAIKQRELDEKVALKVVLDDMQVITVIKKQIKQCKDALTQYRNAGRYDLAQKEVLALEILQTYLPKQLSAQELKIIIKATIIETNATSIRDMGKVMGILKDKIQSLADMGEVSAKVKELLTSHADS